MNPANRRRPRRTPRARPMTRQQPVSRRAVHRELRGHEIRVSPLPSSIVYRPWNSVTLEFSGTSASTPIEINYTDTDVAAQITTQLGITFAGTRVAAFRIIRCRIWSEVLTAAPLTSALRCRFFSIVGEANNTVIQRFPGDVAYAAIGYQWPVEQQNVVLTGISSDHIFSVFPLASGIHYIVHLDILWKSEDPVA